MTLKEIWHQYLVDTEEVYQEYLASSQGEISKSAYHKFYLAQLPAWLKARTELRKLQQ